MILNRLSDGALEVCKLLDILLKTSFANLFASLALRYHHRFIVLRESIDLLAEWSGAFALHENGKGSPLIHLWVAQLKKQHPKSIL